MEIPEQLGLFIPERTQHCSFCSTNFHFSTLDIFVAKTQRSEERKILSPNKTRGEQKVQNLLLFRTLTLG